MLHFKPLTFGRPEKAILLTLLILVGLVIAISTVPLVADGYERLTKVWTDWAIRFGYLGAFLIALVGNLTIIIVFPYTIAIVFLATTGLNPFILGMATGIGAFCGELSGYILGRWGSTSFKRAKPEQYDALERILDYRPRFVQWLLYLFSALPLPDDVLFIPLGMLRYSLWKLTWPAVLGKCTAGLIVAYTGSYALRPLVTDSPLSWGSILGQLGSLVATALVIYAIFKVDWTQTMHKLLKDKPEPAKEPIG